MKGVLVLSAALACLLCVTRARADVTDVSGSGKGLAGGALLGAELFVGGEALLGVNNPWAYGAGCLAGGVGGAFAGSYLERSITEQTSMLLLTTGMLLAIPTSVVVMSATAYRSPPDAQGPSPQLDGSVNAGSRLRDDARTPQRYRGSSPLRVADAEAARVQSLPHRAAPSTGQPTHRIALVQLEADMWMLAVPAVALSDVFSQREREQWGLPVATEVKVQLLSYAF